MHGVETHCSPSLQDVQKNRLFDGFFYGLLIQNKTSNYFGNTVVIIRSYY